MAAHQVGREGGARAVQNAELRRLVVDHAGAPEGVAVDEMAEGVDVVADARQGGGQGEVELDLLVLGQGVHVARHSFHGGQMRIIGRQPARLGEVVVGSDPLRLQPDRLFDDGGRLVQTAELEQQGALVVPGLGVFWPERDCPVEACQRLVRRGVGGRLTRQHLAAVVLRLLVVGPERQRLLEAGQRLGGPLQLDEGDAAVVQ